MDEGASELESSLSDTRRMSERFGALWSTSREEAVPLFSPRDGLQFDRFVKHFDQQISTEVDEIRRCLRP